MKKLFLIITLCFAKAAPAQDQLVRNDSTRRAVKVIEINGSEIRYKLYDNPNGPLYVEYTQNLHYILFENGRREVFGEKKTTPETLLQSRCKNNITLNILSLANQEILLTYMRSWKRFNIQLPVGFGFGLPAVTRFTYYSVEEYVQVHYPAYFLERKQFEAGLGLNYYTANPKRWNYFLGPLFRYQRYLGHESYPFNRSTNGSSDIEYLEKNVVLSCYAAGFNNGFIFRNDNGFTLIVQVSLSYVKNVFHDPITDPSTQQKIYPSIRSDLPLYSIGFNLGYSF